jgi:hypothetical protein
MWRSTKERKNAMKDKNEARTLARSVFLFSVWEKIVECDVARCTEHGLTEISKYTEGKQERKYVVNN